MRKKPDPAIIPLATKLFANGLRIGEVCKRADVSPATWSRWAAGGVPDLAKLRALEAAADDLIAEEAGMLATT